MEGTVTVEEGWNGKGEHSTGTATGGGCSSGVEGLRRDIGGRRRSGRRELE